MDASPTLYTIGHSIHSIEHFVALLVGHGITAVCDVRSQPYSRFNPQYNRERLKHALEQSAIAYVFLGEELGARRKEPSCYEGGKVQYDRVAQTASFREGLGRVQDGMKKFRIALMCAEKDPIECHRTILVARHIEAAGVRVEHILGDGSLESHDQALTRLLRLLKLPESDMFRTRAELVDEAYRLQSDRIAYEKGSTNKRKGAPP
jgi:uncharacterized protein (DUF488 family)